MNKEMSFESLTLMMVEHYKQNKTWPKQAKVNPILFYTIIKPLFDRRCSGDYSLHDCLFSAEDGVEEIEFVKTKKDKKETKLGEKL